MLISVIVPTHNSEKYIRECVQSIMNQTYGDIQIICVDSSKDMTVSILEELQRQDARIEIIRDENGSYGHKLNVGIKLAKGEYIGIVESDDYILPQMYEEMLRDVNEFDIDYIKCATNHFADINGKRVFFVEPRGKVEENVDRVINLEQEPDFAWMCLPRIWTALYRKNFLIENGIWANETPAASYQDTSFTNLVAFFAKKCIYREGAFYCYRNDNVGSSVKSKEKMFCVCDEYRYMKTVLQQQEKNGEDVKVRLLKQKLDTYKWNAMRLSDEGCEQFLDGIYEELKADYSEVGSQLSGREQDVLSELLEKTAMQVCREKQERISRVWAAVLEKLDNSQKCVLIGAGTLGMKVLWLQELIGNTGICALGDNDFNKSGHVTKAYKIETVEEVVKKYPKEIYLIANKHYAEDIMRQLLGLGIAKDKILIVDENISEMSIFKECVNFYL